MLTRGKTRRVEYPDEPGVWFDLRLLSKKDLDEARDARSAKALAKALGMGDVLTNLREFTAGLDRGATPVVLAEDAYDSDTLVRLGVAAWGGPGYNGEDVSQENLDSLDEPTVLFIVRELIPQPKAEADRKNGLSLSTVHSMD